VGAWAGFQIGIKHLTALGVWALEACHRLVVLDWIFFSYG